MKKSADKNTGDWRPFEKLGESQYEKESREAEAILEKQRAGRKARLNTEKKASRQSALTHG
jgi:hypothetical protein